MKKFITLGIALAAIASASAQTPGAVNSIKFAKVTNAVPRQSAVGGCAAGEFYHALYTGASWGDYDNDGYLDLFYSDRNTHVSNSSIASNLYHNSGNGTFTRTAWSPFAGTAFSCPLWIDYDNDGLLDMLLTGLSNYDYQWNDEFTNLSACVCHLYHNDGDGAFTEVTDHGITPLFNGKTGGKGHNWVAAGDYDNDGYTDFVMCGFNGVDRLATEDPLEALRCCYLYHNNKGKGFERVELPVDGKKEFAGLNDGSVILTDLDNDGLLDLFTTGYGYSRDSEIHIYWNNGDGTFSEDTPALLSVSKGGSAVGDLNNDGLADLVLAGVHIDGESKQLFVVRNEGNRKFTRIESPNLEPIDGSYISIGDVNQDGLADMLVGGHGQTHEHTTVLYANQGDFQFEVNGAHYKDQFGKLGHFSRVTHGNQRLIDFDNDGYLDAWLSGWCNGGCSSGCLSELFRNNSASKGVAANQAPNAPAGLAMSTDLTNGKATFTWTAADDDCTPTAAMRYNFYIKEKGSNNTMMLVPADTTTGFIKVDNTDAAMRICSRTIAIPGDGEYEWGVQAIDNGNRGSLWTTATCSFSSSAVNDLDTNSDIILNVNGGSLEYNLPASGTISVYNAIGGIVSQITANGSGTIAMDQGAYIVSAKSENASRTVKVFIP
ncbi:MAG: T9SS type A sorting domain-containing protein [Bacteroidales bacterium]|nr:T9SS type A sorting domain-containing protein [Candidatus Sodaliphilus aphodohippi]